AELERREPELVTTVLARASRWFADRGEIEQALEYADAAGERERVVELIGKSALPMYRDGTLPSVDRWLAGVDEEQVLVQHPWVAVAGALTYALSGRAEAAERWAAAALRARPDAVMPDGSPASAWQALVRSVL